MRRQPNAVLLDVPYIRYVLCESLVCAELCVLGKFQNIKSDVKRSMDKKTMPTRPINTYVIQLSCCSNRKIISFYLTYIKYCSDVVVQSLRSCSKFLYSMLRISWIYTWILYVCLCVTHNNFPKPPKVPTSWNVGSRFDLGQLKTWQSPIFDILIFRGGGRSPYGPVLELALWLSMLISAIWGPRFMTIWPWANFLVLSSMQ